MSEYNSLSHARRELELLEDLASQDAEDPVGSLKMQKHFTQDVLKVVQAIAETGQSGGSIGHFLATVKRCALQQNLSPLTGLDAEWFEHDPDTIQNKRLGSVFKRADGTAYDLDGYVGVDPDGWTFTGGGIPLAPVVFPYTQAKRKYLPRFDLLTQADGEPAPQTHIEDFLFDTPQEVLDFYARNGIVASPPEEVVHTSEAGGAAVLAYADPSPEVAPQ